MKLSSSILTFTFLLLATPASRAASLGTTFTYQGRLNEAGQPVNGSYGMVFYLYDAPTNGNQLGNLGIVSVPVTNGLFTVPLNFDAAFGGNARWLEISVEASGASGFITLSPRQALTPTPYALTALTATSLASYGSPTLELTVDGERALLLQSNPNGAPNLIGGASNNVVETGVAGAVIGGGAVNMIQIGAHDSVIAGGDLNTIQSGAPNSTISGGEFNIIQFLADFGTISGGEDNTIEHHNRGSAIGGGGNNDIQSFANWSTIAGGQGNMVHLNAQESTVGGGYGNEIQTNSVDSTIGGGYGNIVSGGRSTIGGGYENTITHAREGFIGGGAFNTIGSQSPDSTIGGGIANTIQTNSDASTIGGGSANRCAGSYATVPGGLSNRALGNFSLAAGRHAQSLQEGSFTWADSIDAEFNSSATNEFSVRATGGVRFVSGVDSNGAPVAGVSLPAGSGSWSSLSDRNSKTNFAPVNPGDVLARLAQVPIQTWNYKTQNESTRHIGPIAQDFSAAFQVGEDSRHIATVDADGVALAAIQGLDQKVDALKEELRRRDVENAELKQRLESLEKLLGNPR